MAKPSNQPGCIHINNMHAYTEQLADPKYFDHIADEPETSSEYREAARRGLDIIVHATTFIVESSSPVISAYAVAYALGIDAVAEGVSLTDRASQLGCSVAALSKRVKEFQKLSEVSPSAYSYNKKS